MYEKFYNLKEKPFQITPNPTYLYRSQVHENALTYLEYGLMESLGFILLTGEIGTGKTTLVRHIIAQFVSDKNIGVIFNTNVTEDELLYLILRSFELLPDGKNKVNNLEILQLFLIEQYAKKKRVLLIIDEAQNLSNKALEEIRLISNLQSEDRNLIQIMLVGQPELKTRLQQPAYASFSQRVAVNIFLSRLTEEETKWYILYRLGKAGGRPDIFDQTAIDMIYKASNGIPRTINLLCDTAFVYGFADELETINAQVIKQVIADNEIGLRFDPEDKDSPLPTLSDPEVSQPEWDRSERLEDDLRQVRGKVDSLTKLVQDKFTLNPVIEDLIRDSKKQAKPEKEAPIEPLAPKVRTELSKAGGNRWPVIFLACCLFLALGYFLGTGNIATQFSRIYTETSGQKTFKIADTIKNGSGDGSLVVDKGPTSGGETTDSVIARKKSDEAAEIQLGESSTATDTGPISPGDATDSAFSPSEPDRTVESKPGESSHVIDNDPNSGGGETYPVISQSNPYEAPLAPSNNDDPKIDQKQHDTVEPIEPAQTNETKPTDPESHMQISPNHFQIKTQIENQAPYKSRQAQSRLNDYTLLDSKASEYRLAQYSAPAFGIVSMPPSHLGQIIVRRSDTLGSLIKSIYGTFTIPYLNKVKQVNPTLKDANAIEVEDVINFPTIPITVNPDENERWWIRIETKQDLQAALNSLKSYPPLLPAVRLIPLWSPIMRLRFDIISNEFFQDEAGARELMDEIQIYATDMKLEAFNGWDPSTIFMANPFKPIEG
jgi:general secretion pathway protein A